MILSQGLMSRMCLSAVTLSRKTMPQIFSSPVSVQKAAFKNSTCNSTNSMVLINESAITSFIQQGKETTNTNNTSMHTVTEPLEISMISNDPKTSLNTTSYNGPRQPILSHSSGKLEYKLSDLVRKNSLFQMPSNDGAKLEPGRNWQLCTLLGEEKKESSLKDNKRQGEPQSETANNIQAIAANKLHIQSVLSFGESVNKLHFCIHSRTWGKQYQADDSRSRRPEYRSSRSCEYEPEDNGIHYEKMVQIAGMRRIKSHTELHELTEQKNRITINSKTFDPFDEYRTNKPNSVTTTTLLGSPNSIRKQTKIYNQASTEIKFPGYSFLGSVVDEFMASINVRHRHELLLAHHTMENLTNAQTAAHASETNTVVTSKKTDMTVAQSTNLTSNSTVTTSLGTENKRIEAGKSQGFVNALKSWALRKPLNVSCKESNIICPQSF